MNNIFTKYPEIQSYTSDATNQVQNPYMSGADNKINMSDTKYKATFDKNYQRSNPYLASSQAYHHPFEDKESMGYAIGEKLRSGLDYTGNIAGDVLNKGPMIGGLAAMVPGFLAGAAGSSLYNKVTGQDNDNMLRNAMLMALLTGGIGAYSGYLRSQQKPTFKSASSAIDEITSAIASAPGLSFSERSQLTAGVSKLGMSDLNSLASSLATVSGAAVGALVTRYLLNKGLIGSILGAVFGGVVAKSLFGAPTEQTNFLGQKTTSNNRSYRQVDPGVAATYSFI